MSTLRVYGDNNLRSIATSSGGTFTGFLKRPLESFTGSKIRTPTLRTNDVWYTTATDVLVWYMPTPSSGSYSYTNFFINDGTNTIQIMNNTYTPSGYANGQMVLVKKGWQYRLSVTLGNQDSNFFREYAIGA